MVALVGERRLDSRHVVLVRLGVEQQRVPGHAPDPRVPPAAVGRVHPGGVEQEDSGADALQRDPVPGIFEEVADVLERPAREHPGVVPFELVERVEGTLVDRLRHQERPRRERLQCRVRLAAERDVEDREERVERHQHLQKAPPAHVRVLFARDLPVRLAGLHHLELHDHLTASREAGGG
ncbi:MAG: hypothetical protein ABFC38_13005 [Methanospirillum sp.]